MSLYITNEFFILEKKVFNFDLKSETDMTLCSWEFEAFHTTATFREHQHFPIQ